MYQFKEKCKKKKNPNPSDCHSRMNIWLWFTELREMGEEKLLPVRKPLPPWKTPWDTGSKHTICTVTLHKKHSTHRHTLPILLLREKCTLSPLNRKGKEKKKKNAGIADNLLFNKWRESGCDLNSFYPDLQFLNKFPVPSSKQPCISHSFSKKEGRVKLPEGYAGRRQIYHHPGSSPGWMTGPQYQQQQESGGNVGALVTPGWGGYKFLILKFHLP